MYIVQLLIDYTFLFSYALNHATSTELSRDDIWTIIRMCKPLGGQMSKRNVCIDGNMALRHETSVKALPAGFLANCHIKHSI